MKTYKHIFFDLDRTLWDFETNSAAAMRELYEQFKLTELGIKDFDTWHERYKYYNDSYWIDYRDGKIEKELLRWIRFYKSFEQYGIQDEGLSKRFAEAYVALSPTKEVLIEGVMEVLDVFHGKYPLHIITNGFQEVQHIKLTSSKILKYFSTIINSESVGFKKPSKEIYDYACRITNSQAHENIMIGDDLTADIHGALDAGWDAIWFNPNGSKSPREVIEVKYMTELIPLIHPA